MYVYIFVIESDLDPNIKRGAVNMTGSEFSTKQLTINKFGSETKKYIHMISLKV